MTRASADPSPVWVAMAHLDDQGDVTIEGIIDDRSGSRQHSRILVFDQREPRVWLDFAEAPTTDQIHAAYRDHCASALPIQAPETLSGKGDSDTPLPSCSIIVCSRERPDLLRRCLGRLLPAVDNNLEVVVVDNAPTTNQTAAVVAEFAGGVPSVRRVVAPRPGLSRARNVGLASVEAEVVIFIDDDTMPAPGWTRPLLRAFAQNPEVAVATGLVPPAQLDTVAQQLFEERLNWSVELTSHVYSYTRQGTLAPLFPFAAGRFGTGANMAVRKEALHQLGGFDEHLGAGTPSKGGEDLEMFVRALRRGWSLAYVPESVVWHVHPTDLDIVRRNVFGYGAGLTAYLTAVMGQPNRLELVKKVMAGARYGVAQRRHHGQKMSRESGELLRQELLGFAWGPIAYLCAKARHGIVN